MKFRYKTVKEDGSTRRGVVEAPDRFHVYNEVRQPGETIVSVEEAGGGIGGFDFIGYFNMMFSRVKMDEKIMLARNLAAMLDAGLPMTRALSIMERQTKKPRLKKVLGDMGAEIAKGTTFNATLALYPDVFAPLFVSMARAGEESGTLSESLRVVSTQMERVYVLKRKIKGAMLYPGIIVTAMIGIGILMLIYVVPTLTQTFEELNVELPPSTQLIISASNFLVEHTFLAIGGMILVVVGFIALMRTAVGKRGFDFISLHIPVIGTLVKETNSARTARTLGSLLASGVDVLQAIAITRDVVQNSYYQKVLKDVEESASHGEQLGKVFEANEHLYPVLMAEMISVGEETGKLSEMLEQVAKFYEEAVETKTKDLSTIIEPFLMVFIGVVVGFFAISMMSPIYSIANSIE
jgi:type IV pilus assembly protein PilC